MTLDRSGADPAASSPAAVLVDRLIGRLIAEFADAVSRRDHVALTASFAPDGEWHIRTFGHHRGRAQIAAFAESVLRRWDAIVQCVHSGVVDVTGPGTATGHWYLSETGVRAGVPVSLTGRYTDSYVELDGCWRFRSRTFDLMHEDRDGRRIAHRLPDDAIDRSLGDTSPLQNTTGAPR